MSARRILALVCALFLAPLDARAEHDGVALYSLQVDGAAAGEVLAIRHSGELWISLEALLAAGLDVKRGRRAKLDGKECVALSSLADLSVTADESALRIDIRQAVAASHDSVRLVTLRVDGVERGEALLVERGGERWVSAEALEAAGIAVTARREKIDGAAHVALSALQGVALDGDVLAIDRAPAVAAAPLDQAALFRLVVDGRESGEVLLVRRGRESFVSVEALQAAGIRQPGRRESIDGVESVSLSSLAPVIASIDEAAYLLRIDTRPAIVRAPPSGFDQAAVYRVDVNGRPAGEAIVLRKDAEVWLSVEALESAGIGGFGGERYAIEGAEHVRLATLQPEVAYKLDERSLAVKLFVVPELLLDGEQVGLFALQVNGQRAGETRVRLRGRDVHLPVAALEKAGLARFGGVRRETAGESWVLLSSLAPDIEGTIDRAALTLALTASPELFPGTTRNVASSRPADLVYARNTSAFVNYALAGDLNGSTQAFAETGVSAGGALFTSTFSGVRDGRLTRHSTALTYDDRRHLLRFTAGDFGAGGGPLGGGALLGGISVSREYGIDPYAIHTPTVDLDGVATTPSTVEVYVNERLVRREEVPAGKFQLRDVLLQSGQGSTRMVIRDAFGRERQVRSDYYSGSALLDRGRHHYTYAAGFVRGTARLPEQPRHGRSGFSTPTPAIDPGPVDLGTYGEPAIVGTHRVGIARWLTAGLRAEAMEEVQSSGAFASAALPFGNLDLALASSADQGEPGGAASLAWSFSSDHVAFGLSAVAMSDRYAHLSLRAAADRPEVSGGIYVGTNVVSRAMLSVHHNESVMRDAGRTSRSAATASYSLKRGSLFVSAARATTDGLPATLSVFAGFSMSVGRAGNANVSVQDVDGRTASELTVARSAPTSSGVGYRLSARQTIADPSAPGGASAAGPFGPGGPDSANGAVQWQGRHGQLEMTGGAAGTSYGGTLRAAGGIVAVGGSVYATRPVQGGFALVQVPGVRGVRVLAHNQEIGRTNRKGNLFVPNMLAYYGNRLSIADEDVPIRYAVPKTDLLIATPNRGGAVVRFPVTRVHAVRAKLVLATKQQPVTPAYGEVTITIGADRFVSPIGRNGEIWLENLPQGRHSGMLRWRGRSARFEIVVPPASEAPVVDLGRITARE